MTGTIRVTKNRAETPVKGKEEWIFANLLNILDELHAGLFARSGVCS
jgi:hypothetical protein